MNETEITKEKAAVHLLNLGNTVDILIEVNKRAALYKSKNPLYKIHLDKIEMNLERLQEIIKQTKTML